MPQRLFYTSAVLLLFPLDPNNEHIVGREGKLLRIFIIVSIRNPYNFKHLSHFRNSIFTRKELFANEEGIETIEDIKSDNLTNLDIVEGEEYEYDADQTLVFESNNGTVVVVPKNAL